MSEGEVYTNPLFPDDAHAKAGQPSSSRKGTSSSGFLSFFTHSHSYSSAIQSPPSERPRKLSSTGRPKPGSSSLPSSPSPFSLGRTPSLTSSGPSSTSSRSHSPPSPMRDSARHQAPSFNGKGLHSSHSQSAFRGTSSPAPPLSHPYGSFMPSSVVDADEDDDPTCPVCLESLSLRLQGEKPHIVPQCGHRLHEACFEAVYGGVVRARNKPGALGLCGVCRRDMKLGEEGEGPGRKNKFAMLSGARPPPGSDTHKMRSASNRTLDLHDGGSLHDPEEDDDLVQNPIGSYPSSLPPSTSDRMRGSTGTASTSSTLTGGRRGSADTMKGPGSSSGSTGGGGQSLNWDIVKPIITVRAEHSSIARSAERDKKQNLTCMVTIEMPSRWHTPIPQLEQSERRGREDAYGGGRPRAALSTHSDPYGQARSTRSLAPSARSDPYDQPPRPSSPAASNSSVYSAYAYGSTAPAIISTPSGPVANPFAAVVDDLQHRMADWKGHSPDEFGLLKLYDYIHVRKEKNVREFLVYLFEEAILCVTDDKRKGLTGKIVDGISGPSDKLRLKGRVYVRHIRTVIDTSQGGDLSLTIMMSDDALDEFVMTFKEKTSLDIWKSQIEALVKVHTAPSVQAPPPAPSAGMGRARGIVGLPSHDSLHGSEYSNASDGSVRSATHSSAFSGYTRTTSSTAPLSAIIQEEDSRDLQHFNHSSPRASTYTSSTSNSYPLQLLPSSSLGPRDFTPLDLMLILSVPASGPTSLKLGIIKSSLDFIIQSVGPRTRLSIVTFSAGDGTRGVLRKTPFVAVGKPEGRKRLEAIMNELGGTGEGMGMIEHKEERVNVVTAVNLALDVVLQRKHKSALTGMVLMNDGKDGAQKQQMDLVMARAEAANVPIHAIGWGRSHDPSSLWLLSNHTGGSYTFVKEFYDLRDALAGCIGGILSIAATHVKLHISVPERRWFRIRKVSGTPGAVVSSEGKDVDIDIGELRYGMKKDLLVEVEMSLAGYGDSFGQSMHERSEPPTFSTATDAFFLSKVGLNPSALDEYQPSNFYEDEYDGMPDEVPLFEVNTAYRDPAAGKNISRLNHSPCLLTITVIPPSPAGTRSPPLASAPEIVRRRMELLCSDMLTRTLLLMSRRNDAQAKRLLQETKRIISTIRSSLAPTSTQPSRSGSRTSLSAHSVAHATLLACSEDVGTVLEGCANREQFDSHYRNFAAQQAVVLRDQSSITARTATERLFWTADHSLWMVGKSQQWRE